MLNLPATMTIGGFIIRGIPTQVENGKQYCKSTFTDH
jgi:hypothetical protein